MLLKHYKDARQSWGYGIKRAPRQLSEYTVNHSDPNAGTWMYPHVQTRAHSRRDDCQSILVQNEKPKLNMSNSDSQQEIKNDSVH